MSDFEMRALGAAWGALDDMPAAPLPTKQPQAAGASPEAPQTPFIVERAGDCVAVRVSAEPLTLHEAQDLTARLLVVTGPMWAETLPKERI